MLTGLDHIIIGVNNLEQAATIFSQQLGLAVSGGGIHPLGGTANRIIVIGDTYLELIAIRTPAEVQQSMIERLAKGSGYLNFAIASLLSDRLSGASTKCVGGLNISSDDIQADSAAMVQRGVHIIGPTAGQLKSDDGRSRGWSRVDIERPELAQRYPFIIQHDSTGEERRFRLAGWQTPPEHPLGVTKVLSTTIAVADLAEAAPRFLHIYGLEPSPSFTGEADSWEAMLVSFPLGESGQSFELAEPLSFTSDLVGNELLPDPGALTRYLQQFGESLCRMTLAVEDIGAARNYLDENKVTYTYEEHQYPVIWIHPDCACGAVIVLHEMV